MFFSSWESPGEWWDVYTEADACYRLTDEGVAMLVRAIEARERIVRLPTIYGRDCILILAKIDSIMNVSPAVMEIADEHSREIKEARRHKGWSPDDDD